VIRKVIMVVIVENFIFIFEDWPSLSYSLQIIPKGMMNDTIRIKVKFKLRIIFFK
jgi:hypothetical protein